MSEWSRIALLRAALGGPASERVLLGIGDDCAVLDPGREPLVWTVDAAVDGVHFRRDLLTMADIGYRSTMAAASDLAAMGAEPLGLLAALVLPRDVSDDDLAELARGQREAAEAIGAPVIGGNLARGGELSITTTALGAAAKPLARSGAREGDHLWLAGPVGLAAAGLALLIDGREQPEQAVRAWRRPVARIADGRAAAQIAVAAIDVSDGLAQDVGHLAQASGVGLILDEAAIVGDALREAAAAAGRDAITLALHGGEDYALVAAAPSGQQIPGFVRIGEVVAGQGTVALRRTAGTIEVIEARGFDHFT